MAMKPQCVTSVLLKAEWPCGVFVVVERSLFPCAFSAAVYTTPGGHTE